MIAMVTPMIWTPLKCNYLGKYLSTYTVYYVSKKFIIQPYNDAILLSTYVRMVRIDAKIGQLKLTTLLAIFQIEVLT